MERRLSLAQLGQTDVAPTILKLLSREELSGLRYYDRESDPKNPAFRNLSDLEQQRILINTMIGAAATCRRRRFSSSCTSSPKATPPPASAPPAGSSSATNPPPVQRVAR